MSMKLMVQAMQLKVGNSSRKLVLLKLADNANDQGVCFPSYQYIADICEISKRSAISHIEALIKMGLVTKKSRKNKDGSSSNLYQLYLEEGGENSALGGSENISPITSHSFESFNESLKEFSNENSKTAPTAKKDLRIDYQRIADLYNAANEFTGGRLLFVEKINQDRKKTIKKFLLELTRPDMDCVKNYFDTFFENIKPFHFGENGGWIANFDYAIKPTVVLKVREGAL